MDTGGHSEEYQPTDRVELRDEHTGHRSKEAKNVASPRIVVRRVTLRKERDARVDAVLADSLAKENIRAIQLL